MRQLLISGTTAKVWRAVRDAIFSPVDCLIVKGERRAKSPDSRESVEEDRARENIDRRSRENLWARPGYVTGSIEERLDHQRAYRMRRRG